MRDRQVCITCGKQSPETETNYTLISAQFGWRLTRRRAPNGDFIVEWRCAECWRDHKKKTEDEAPSATKGTTLPEKPAERHRPVPHPVPRTPGAAARSPSKPPSKAPSRPPPSQPTTPTPPPPAGTRPRRP